MNLALAKDYLEMLQRMYAKSTSTLEMDWLAKHIHNAALVVTELEQKG